MIRFLVNRYVTVFFVTILLVVFGFTAYVTMPRESNPDITIPVVMITTPYVGVSPEDIEGLVTIPLENELASLQDVKAMKSTSSEGFSLVSIEFEPDVVIEDALQKVRDRVNRARPKIPDDVEEPTVREISFSDIPVMLVTIAGEQDEEVLKTLAEDLEDEVTRIPGVLEVDISGGLTREIKVHVLPERLQHYSLALHDVTGAIASENVNIPGGNVDAGRGNFLLRVPGEFTSPKQVEQVAIKRVGDRPVLIKDVARVVDGYEERKTYSRMNGQRSVTVAVTKRAGSNILDVAQGVKAELEVQSEVWPENVDYQVLADQSRYIEIQVQDLQNNIITALILVVSVIVVFMGLRQSLFVAAAIPLSMLMGFLVLDALGFTLNFVVLFSLILALGMLVDNAIVVVENIYRHIEEGKDRVNAAIDGTNEVAMAVAASTATTVAAFGPLVLWGGIMGEFMGYLPKTLITVLVSSLVVAVCILPAFASRLMPEVDEPIREATDEPEVMDEADLGLLMRGYKRLLEFSIDWRYISAITMFGLLFLTFGAYYFLNHGTEFFPETEPDRAVVAIRAPEGTSLEQTDRITRQVETILGQEANIEVWVAEVGVSGGGNQLAGSSSAPNEAKISIDFLPDDTVAKPGEVVRFESTTLTVERVRNQISQIPGAEVTIEKERMGPPVGAPITIEVTGPDFHTVGEAAQQIKRRLFQLGANPPEAEKQTWLESTLASLKGESRPDYAHLQGISKLSDNYRVGRPEFRLRVDRAAAKRVGVSTQTVGNTVRTAVAGAKASALRQGEDEYDIVVELAPEYRDDLQSVLGLRLPGRIDTSPDTFSVPLSSVASFELAGGSGSISHVDQDLMVTIDGDVKELEGLDYNADDVKTAITAVLEEMELPPGVHAELGGSADEQAEAAAFLSRAFAIACALILIVLVTQFDSLAMPLIIVATVMLSLIGVLWGLLITGTPFGVIMTGIGVISLAGVVVNNAIVLLDYVQQLQDRGYSVRDSLVQAGLTRFRPVMLTAITTTLGLVPMALAVSVDFLRLKLVVGATSAQWWGPMAVAVIFGLSFATLLTLVMVPTFFSIYDDFRRLPEWIRGRSGETSKEVSGSVPAVAKIGLGILLLAASAPAQAVTLEEAWTAAERNNLQLQIAHQGTRQAASLPAQALSTIQPRVTMQATWVLNQQEIAFDPSDGFEIPPEFEDFIEFPETDPVVIQRKQFWQGNVTVAQRFFSGQAPPLLAGARRLKSAAEFQEESARQQIRAGVARAFYGLATARKARELGTASVELARNQLDLANRRKVAGLDAQRAVLQAQLAEAQALRDLRSSEAQVAQAEEVFARLTGLPRDAEVELPGPVEVPESLDEARQLAQARRPDIEAAGLQADAIKAERTGNNMNWLPTIDGVFTYNYDQNTGFNDQEWQWRLSGQANWTLWDGGMRLAKNRENTARLRQAQLQQEQLRLQAREEVVVAWEDYERAGQALTSVEREMELARESLDLSERSFEAGSATWLEVEQARLAYLGSELNQITELMNRDLAAIQLLVATGSL